VSVSNFLPWFYQRSETDNKTNKNSFNHDSFKWIEDVNVSQTTTNMRKKIEKIANYPSYCVRESDSFELKELTDKDLSSVDPVEQAPLLLVDTVDKLKQCAEEISISKSTELAFDLEMHNVNRYSGMTCLMQLAIPSRNYVIDVLAPGIWSSLKFYLEPFFLDANIVKIGHAIGDMDVPALHRDFGLFIVNVFDTSEFIYYQQR